MLAAAVGDLDLVLADHGGAMMDQIHVATSSLVPHVGKEANTCSPLYYEEARVENTQQDSARTTSRTVQ